MKLLCKLGKHSWIYKELRYNSEEEPYYRSRHCEKCQRIEENIPTLWYKKGVYEFSTSKWTRVA